MKKDTPLFEIRNVSKYFAKVVANKDVSFSIKKGEVLALLGENGAGKSTIMKILFGLYAKDEGEILKNGVVQEIHNPKKAQQLGIAMIQQHFSLVSAHTVTENIVLGTVKGKVDYVKYEQKVKQIAEKYHFNIPTSRLVKDLDVGTQQKVEIVKALYLNSELLIMDEPTAVLTPQETERLMEFITRFTEEGHSVIFITHKLKEVMQVANRIIIMRDGKVCGEVLKNETSEHELTRLMMGKELEKSVRQEISVPYKEKKLSIRNLSIREGEHRYLLHNISFDIFRGEIFGIAGVSGNGQDELCEAIVGTHAIDEGEIFLNDVPIQKLSIQERIERGIGYVPVNRHRDAMVGEMTIAENIILRTSFDKKWYKNHLIDQEHVTQFTKDQIEYFQIKASDPQAKINSLSGGNQQKVILAREIYIGNELLLLNQPTRGLDLGAIKNIHDTIFREKNAGKSILMISTELSEIFDVCDRVAVMYRGEMMGIFENKDLSTTKIGYLMAGIKRGEVS